MTHENIFADFVDRQGWNELDQVEILMRFIDEKSAEEHFILFLKREEQDEDLSLEPEYETDDYDDDIDP